jgi:hypothetical protein
VTLTTSACGAKRTSRDVRSLVAIGGNAHILFQWRQDRF